MWDEEKFFKDYRSQTDRVKPDKDFVERLKQQTNPDNVAKLEKRIKKRRQMTYVAAAATVVLCVGIGAGKFFFRENGDNMRWNEMHAGKTQDEPVKTSGISDSNRDKELSKVIVMLKDSSSMLDNMQGESLSTEEREKLVELLKHAEKVENTVEISGIDFENEAVVYYCVGEETVKIEFYKERYARIGDNVYVSRDDLK